MAVKHAKKVRYTMKINLELVKDTAMVLAGLSFYIISASFLIANMAKDFSLNLM